MSTSNNDPAWASTNPFVPTAVASAGEFDADPVTIRTPAIREAFRYLDIYLRAAPGESGPSSVGAGNVIALVGDYGTGKTHLAGELRRRARRSVGTDGHVMYIDAPAAGDVPAVGETPAVGDVRAAGTGPVVSGAVGTSFVSLYRRFIDKLQESDVVRRVGRHYSDALIDYLDSSELTAAIAERLRVDRDIDVRDIAEQLGPGEAPLLGEVERRLREELTPSTEFENNFVTALTLMLRPGFQDAVWSWLAGSPPLPILTERGITTAIDTDEVALEAMGMFAVLYGRRNHRFVLVIDEVEKVLSGPRRPEGAVLGAFKKLLTVFAKARAFLVLAGLPDFLQSLEEDVRQRIGRVVHMSALSADNVRDFIIDSQRRLSPDADLEPFTPESVNYITQLTEGVPRKVIRLCYHAYRRAVEEGELVTPAMVREVARTHTNILSTEDIRARVRMVLGREGWEHSTNHMLEASPLARLDEWVYIGDRGSGYGILVTDPVLDDDDFEQLNQRALAIRTAAPEIRTLLIINGYVEPDILALLGELFGVQPMVYHPRLFEDDLVGMLKAMASWAHHGTEDQTIGAMHERVERINRQQSSIYRSIQQIAAQIDAMQLSSERRLGHLQSDLTRISQALSAASSTVVPERAPELPQRMPPEVLRLFSRALDSLADIGQVDRVLREAFAVGSGRSSHTPPASLEIRAALRSQKAVKSLGVAVLLQKLVEAFQTGIAEWYLSYTDDPQGRLRSAHQEELQELCYTYDSIYEYLPLHQLTGLSELTTLPIGAGGQQTEAVGMPLRRVDVRKTLDGLGARVQRTMLAAATSSTVE
ncbi:MAG TPA: hypothetical protein VFQ77_18645 [Pseudonocardiaceae bacterium]|jgi:Cdc6-like AAA superfamily ATPase|nr:hypothetical protein [Pseudonocardiaceae bacterium]